MNPQSMSIYQSEDSIDALIGVYQEDVKISCLFDDMKKHYNLSTSTVYFCQHLITFVDRICNLLTPKVNNYIINTLILQYSGPRLWYRMYCIII